MAEMKKLDDLEDMVKANVYNRAKHTTGLEDIMEKVQLQSQREVTARKVQ